MPLALKKLDERISDLVAVHCLPLGASFGVTSGRLLTFLVFLAGLLMMIAGDCLAGQNPLWRRKRVAKVTEYALRRGWIELYLTTHRQSTVIAAARTGIEMAEVLSKTAENSITGCLNLA